MIISEDSSLAPEDVGDVDDIEDEVGEDEEFLEPDDIVEAIVVPKGKPLVEVLLLAILCVTYPLTLE